MRSLVIGLLCVFVLGGTAEARGHRHLTVGHHAAVGGCVETGDIMRPCAYQPNFFAGVRSIQVKMKRVSSRLARRHRTLVAYAPATRNVQHEEHHTVTKPQEPKEIVGTGVVKASTGAVAYVAAKATKAFQCVVDALESTGYKIHEMGGFANRGHIRHSLHYSGMALDINQESRNVTRPRMPSNEIQLANDCGLISGAQWSGDPDSGHFQLGGWAGYGKTHYAARHRHVRYAYHRKRGRYANL